MTVGLRKFSMVGVSIPIAFYGVAYSNFGSPKNDGRIGCQVDIMVVLIEFSAAQPCDKD